MENIIKNIEKWMKIGLTAIEAVEPKLGSSYITLEYANIEGDVWTKHDTDPPSDNVIFFIKRITIGHDPISGEKVYLEPTEIPGFTCEWNQDGDEWIFNGWRCSTWSQKCDYYNRETSPKGRK